MAATGGRVRKTGTTLTIVAMLATGLSLAITSPAEARKRNVKRVAYAPPAASIVVDVKTGRVLHGQNEDAPRIPASITKVMTLYLLFEQLERGRLQLDSELRVSANAAAQAPSKLGLRAGSTIEVEDAIKALVTKSANDVATVVAENIGGSEEEFARMMTARARSIGMGATTFRNPHGLPSSPPNMTTARDLATLGRAIQDRFPRYYAYFGTRVFHFGSAAYANHNRLLGRVEGVDGIKTGYINASGFNLVSSVKRDGRKIVAVVMGGRTARSRDAHMVQLIETYLPKASRARGYDEELVAAVRSAPPVAASVPHPEPAALAGHPQPPARPNIVVASAAAVPDVVGPDAADPADGYGDAAGTDGGEDELQVASLPAGPVSMATATLPSSAAEAFADVAPLDQGSSADGQDLLGEIIERKTGVAPMAVASIAPVATASIAPRKAKPVKVEPAEEIVPAAQKSAAKGWVIQVGAVDTQKAASALLKKAQAAAGAALGSAEPMTEVTTSKGKTVVRARFAGFASEKAAKKACAAVKKGDLGCFTLRL